MSLPGETSVREWVRQAQIDSGKGPAGALTTAEKEGLAGPRKENRELRMEREPSKKENGRLGWSQPPVGVAPQV